MMKVASIHSEKEAVNFLLGKVGDLQIKNYVNHLPSEAERRNSIFAIVPDILAFEYPAGKQIVNDSGATQSEEAFCEVKSYQANKTRYNDKQHKLITNTATSLKSLAKSMNLMQ